MSKKRASLTLRKPGQGEPAPSLRDVESFIEGDSEEPAAKSTAKPATITPIATKPASPSDVAVPSFRRANKSIVKRKTKADRRRTTVYLDLLVASQLAKHCAADDLEMSDVVNEALGQFLSQTK